MDFRIPIIIHGFQFPINKMALEYGQIDSTSQPFAGNIVIFRMLFKQLLSINKYEQIQIEQIN